MSRALHVENVGVDRLERLPRVLFFDCWAIPGAVEKFARIARLAADVADFRLLHLGSFREYLSARTTVTSQRDGQLPKTEVVHGIDCVDISLFRGMSFEDVLLALNPDVVVDMNMSGLRDRVLYITAARLGIPAVFMQHGAWLDPDALELVAKEEDRSLRAPGEYLKRIPSFLWALKNYLRGRDLADPRPAKVVWRLLSTPASSHVFPAAAEELWPTRAMVFTPQDSAILARTHHLPDSRLRIVGNPELDAVCERKVLPMGSEERAERLVELGLEPHRPVVCYLEEALVEQNNLFGWDEARRVLLLRELCEVCQAAGVQLLVRPHPVTKTVAMQQVLGSRSGVVMSRELSLLDSCDLSMCVVVTMSTAAETALVLGKPVVVPMWHVNGDRVVSRYARFGAAHTPESPIELRELLLSLAAGLTPDTRSEEFVATRLGPVDGRATRRIADGILELAKGHVREAGSR